ncbi:kinesin-like protein KIF21A [Chrysoperla carnea]|uniref:kinesin-like protein KIF21A n=1 Tax=Chrysoperla carnea TaxID=189513 RepID=UPI001D0695C9|nr:kinesin-like protein KIF21A [Chrysoperla carnea]
MGDDICVQVAVRVRPQIPREIIDMCRICTRVTPGEPQITIGTDKSFTYDYVFDTAEQQEYIYDTCVSKLVEGALEGYNATVLAYGQTGSGKTYTMGTGFDVELPMDQVGIIPRAIQHIFNGIEERIQRAADNGESVPQFKLVAQFMEIYNEEIIDLFDPTKDYESKKAMKIHEDTHGDIHVVGVKQKPVLCVDDALQCLRIGALSRRTASTQMNSQSSRSHAIFSLLIKQQRIIRSEENNCIESEFETLTSKFHFVDLAGSERMKRTGATGERAKEGISINCGLLALGNVISALGTKGKQRQHIPYRDSKLTRMLQDSLGGNSQTLMIACISPSDRDFMETLNTLKYANRAKNIKNKVILNQDKSSRTIAMLRQEIALLQIELLEYKQGKRFLGSDGQEEINDVFQANKMMESELNHMRNRIKAMQETINVITVKNSDLLANRAKSAWITSNTENSDNITDIIQNYIKEIEELRVKLMESEFTCQNLRKQIAKLQANISVHSNNSFLDDSTSILDIAKYDLQKQKMNILSRSSTREMQSELGDHEDEDKDVNDVSDSETESDEKSEDRLGTELAELSADIDMKQKLIEELELSQKRIQTLKKNYENQLLQLQVRINDTQAERDRVLNNLHNQTLEPEKVRTLKDKYEKKIMDLQSQLKQLQAAKKEHNKMLRDQTQYETQLKTLKNDLYSMKRNKVKLINQMKEESARHKDAETRRMREIAQLQKESRKNAKMLRSMEAENKQKEQILKRKQEEVIALRRLQREKSLSRSPSSPTRFSSKEAKQKWSRMEKNINKIVLSKQVLAYQERDMNRLLIRRESISRNLERLRQRKAVAQSAGEDHTDIDIEIDNDMEELSYIQDSITETQHNIVQIEESKENPDISDVQAVAQSVNSMAEAKYLIDKLLNLALSQSYLASQRDLLVQERETELEQIKQEHVMVNQLLEYMVQRSDDMKVSLVASSSTTTNEAASSNSSSRSSSPSRLSIMDLDASKMSTSLNSCGSKSKIRRRTAVSREVLLGMKSTSDIPQMEQFSLNT